MSVNFDDTYSRYLTLVNEQLNEYCDRLSDKAPILKEAMVYSVKIGGKRIRPVCMLACSEMLGVDLNTVIPFAVALEFIHTYSLIHDDLPAMDNDDFRRGKPSNHKVFGEGTAILAGDALLNSAHEILINECFKGEKYVRAAKLISECAGMNGMIAGQQKDIEFEKQTEFTKSDLDFIYENKTGKLLIAPFVVASILSDNKYYIELETFGRLLGRMFQMTDDILDVEGNFDSLGKTIGKDKEENKLTSVKLYGLDRAKVEADLIMDQCLTLLEGIDENTEFFEKLAIFIRTRQK